MGVKLWVCLGFAALYWSLLNSLPAPLCEATGELHFLFFFKVCRYLVTWASAGGLWIAVWYPVYRWQQPPWAQGACVHSSLCTWHIHAQLMEQILLWPSQDHNLFFSGMSQLREGCTRQSGGAEGWCYRKISALWQKGSKDPVYSQLGTPPEVLEKMPKSRLHGEQHYSQCVGHVQTVDCCLLPIFGLALQPQLLPRCVFSLRFWFMQTYFISLLLIQSYLYQMRRGGNFPPEGIFHWSMFKSNIYEDCCLVLKIISKGLKEIILLLQHRLHVQLGTQGLEFLWQEILRTNSGFWFPHLMFIQV